MKAFVDINRRSFEGENRMEFVIKLGVGKSITATISAEDFLMAMTGRSEVSAEVKTRNVKLEVVTGQPARKGGE
ncbi:hypothetical protein MZUP3_580 [Erwinia phage vB_EhrS_49]|uniref:Uncharacterized protein n=1 Tax=Erwinia phage vB_EhrS_49 TaxID=2283026 RepID=A0A4Y1NR47_9CAUD|nr:hypothetical protein HOV54_gp58 [Erwinia phage vB_EhrS_49]AXH43468.1 hypothetical protein MZUP3_580 [Erwinia phage vB_EhrS_49]